MRQFGYKRLMVPVIDKVFCNKCGKNIIVKEHKGEGFIRGCSVEMRYGYGSEYDGLVTKFELCDDCSDELTNGFKHPCEETEEL